MFNDCAKHLLPAASRCLVLSAWPAVGLCERALQGSERRRQARLSYYCALLRYLLLAVVYFSLCASAQAVGRRNAPGVPDPRDYLSIRQRHALLLYQRGTNEGDFPYSGPINARLRGSQWNR